MYTCKIYYSQDEVHKLNKALNNGLIHSISSRDNFVIIKTRKLWKLYWLDNHFKDFKHDFSCYIVKRARLNEKLPASIYANFKVVIENKDWFYQKTSIYFHNIHDAWKIKLSLFLH